MQTNEEPLPGLQNEDNITVSEFIEPSKELNDRMNDISFDFEAKTVTLNSGYKMPILGLGTYSLLDDMAVESVAYALENGGRLVDTASFYRNEESVGDGIRQSGIPREEIFITTKLYPNQYGDAAAAIDEALEKLGVDYIDARVIIGTS